MIHKPKRDIMRKGASGAVTRALPVKRDLRELGDISIDAVTLLLLTTLGAVTLFNILEAHAAMVLARLAQLLVSAAMQLALPLP